MFAEPNYIPISVIAREPVRHTWDEWDPYPALGLQDEETISRLAKITDRAQIAYAIGCAEWVVYRFAGVSVDPSPYEYLEAFWAYVMSDNLKQPPATNDGEWTGPVRAAIDMSLTTIINTIALTETATGDTEAAFAELIVLHVLPDPHPFNVWKEMAITRLTRYFPRTRKEDWGPPVPREIFDSSVDLTAEIQPALIKQFLSRVNTDKNKFLLPFSKTRT
jgi:hypothetical protein